MNNAAIFCRIWFVNTPFDSPWRALSRVFWAQFDPVGRSAVNERKTRERQVAARTPALGFREFAAERLLQSLRNQKTICRTVQALSNGINFIKIPLIITRIIKFKLPTR